MRHPLPLALTLALLVGSVPALPCTVVYYADEETALAGNNEDFFFPYTQATFFPPEAGKHGGVYFGYQARHGVEFGAYQGGVNDQGLFFDGLATDSVPVTRSQDKPSYAGNLLEKMLETAAAMEEESAKDYNKWANECSQNADAMSKQLFEELVADEERHYDQYDTELDNLARFGKDYLALQSIERSKTRGAGGGAAG